MNSKRIPIEVIVRLRNRLGNLPSRSHERRLIMQEAANLYDVSEATLYRALREYNKPKALRRSDHGTSRILPVIEMEAYCEIIAAMKMRTSNEKGRHFSTSEAIR